MQVMPATARSLQLTADEPDSNVLAGARFLRQMLDRFRSSDLALAAYNAGPTAVERAGGAPSGVTMSYVAERDVALARVQRLHLDAGDRRRRARRRRLDAVRLAEAAAPARAGARARPRRRSVDEIVVVLGAHEVETDARTVRCPDWEQGPGASLRCGLAALGPEVEAAAVVLADGPDLAPEAIDRVVEAWREGAARCWRRPTAASAATRSCSDAPPGDGSRTRARARSSRSSCPATTSALQETSILPMTSREGCSPTTENRSEAHGARPTARARRRHVAPRRARACTRASRSRRPRAGPGSRPTRSSGSRRAASTASRPPTPRSSRRCSTRPRSGSTTARRGAGRAARAAAPGRGRPPRAARRAGRGRRDPRRARLRGRPAARPRGRRRVAAASQLAPPWKIAVDVLNGGGDINYTRQVASRIGALGYHIGHVAPREPLRLPADRRLLRAGRRGDRPAARAPARRAAEAAARAGRNPSRLVVIVGPPRVERNLEL